MPKSWVKSSLTVRSFNTSPIWDLVLDLKEQLAFMVAEKKAKQMLNEDSTLLDLKWKTIRDMELALEDNVKVEAIQRLLICPSVSDSSTRYFADVMTFFFDDDIRGCMYIGTPSG